MPIHCPKADFIDFYIRTAPEKPGVYALWDEREIIFYGYTTGSIRDSLFEHKQGRHGSCTAAALFFIYEPTAFPDYRFRALMREFESENGRPPLCNKT